MSKTCVKLCYRGRGEISNTVLKSPWYFVIDCLKFTKKKERWGSIHAVSNHSNMFNEFNYVTLYSVMNIMTKNGAKIMHKMPQKMILSYYYLTFVRKGLLQAHHYRCCNLVKLLCIYFCYFNLLNHG